MASTFQVAEKREKEQAEKDRRIQEKETNEPIEKMVESDKSTMLRDIQNEQSSEQTRAEDSPRQELVESSQLQQYLVFVIPEFCRFAFPISFCFLFSSFFSHLCFAFILFYFSSASGFSDQGTSHGTLSSFSCFPFPIC